ncbi:hypothetical protein XHV734_1962 [Xanthomonas hortorum pv. vitians]|nr:hypothetical protein XHV734_1962 [Xanthomonas hortorum pv. vitians]
MPLLVLDAAARRLNQVPASVGQVWSEPDVRLPVGSRQLTVDARLPAATEEALFAESARAPLHAAEGPVAVKLAD